MNKTTDEKHLEWHVTGRSSAQDYAIFSVYQHEANHPASAASKTFTVVDSPDWVNVIALTSNQNVVLIRQYRHGVERLTTEIPGGLVDPGESALEAGKRELREETGYTAQEWHILGRLSPNPAFMNNTCTVLLALNAQPTEEQELDPNEVIDVKELPLESMRDLVRSGEIDHTLVISAFYLLDGFDAHRTSLGER